MKIDDFEFPIQVQAEFTQNNIPFMAQQVAKVHEGEFAGTEILMGPNGLMFSVIKHGEFNGFIGFSYNTILNASLDDYVSRFPIYLHDE